MKIDNLNKFYTCSTAVIGGFIECPKDVPDLLYFAKDLQSLLTTQMISSIGHNGPATHYSFVLASTNAYFKRTKKFLDELGFIATDPSPNKKNGTIVQLHVISVHTLLENLVEIVGTPAEIVKPKRVRRPRTMTLSVEPEGLPHVPFSFSTSPT